jgi:transposase-like protein
MHTMPRGKLRPTFEEVKTLLSEDQDWLRPLVQAVLQELLEAEMTEALCAEKGERTPHRLGYRAGSYGRTLITRVGKLELRVPQDRPGRFSTELFERYQRSEKALVAALAEMYRRALGSVRARQQRVRPVCVAALAHSPRGQACGPRADFPAQPPVDGTSGALGRGSGLVRAVPPC